jgi:hypothetical protein
MKTSRTAPVVALLALAATPALAPGQGGKPPKPPKGTAGITLDVRPATTIFGSPVIVEGRLTGTSNDVGVTVRLEADTTPPYGDRYEDTGMTTQTVAAGRYTFTVRPALNSQYRATAQASPPVTSGPRTVSVRPKVGLVLSDSTPRRGRRVRFRGSVTPAHDGSRVLVQRRTSTGAFRTVARTTLLDAGDDRSTYRRRVRIPSDGVYRVKLPAHADHANGFSRTRRIDARPRLA